MFFIPYPPFFIKRVEDSKPPNEKSPAVRNKERRLAAIALNQCPDCDAALDWKPPASLYCNVCKKAVAGC